MGNVLNPQAAVMKGVVNTDDGQRIRIVSLPKMEALAITSTVQLLFDHDRVTSQLQQEISEAQRRLQKRLGQRKLMTAELQDAFGLIREREAIPSRIDPMRVKWLPGGRFEFELLEGEPDGPDREADVDQEGGAEGEEPAE